VPGLPLQTDAFVLLKRPATDSFQGFTVFSPTEGTLLVLQRVPRKSGSKASPPLDLFDEAQIDLESSNQGQTWFVKEARVITRHPALGRSYETLRLASALTSLVARNAVPEESRADVATLLRQALASFASGGRPELVWIKSLYRFARHEGYPIKEEWFPSLTTVDRESLVQLLNRPLSEQTADAVTVVRLTQRFEQYLRGHTEILLD
jgi:hypothetical protein